MAMTSGVVLKVARTEAAAPSISVVVRKQVSGLRESYHLGLRILRLRCATNTEISQTEKCELCPKPPAHNSVLFCDEQPRFARARTRKMLKDLRGLDNLSVGRVFENGRRSLDFGSLAK